MHPLLFLNQSEYKYISRRTSTPSSHLTACCALLLGIDVDGCLIDARERIVSGIVSGGSKHSIQCPFKKQNKNTQLIYVTPKWQPIRWRPGALLSTYTEQYGLFLWLTKLLAVSTILQTSQWKQALCQFWQMKRQKDGNLIVISHTSSQRIH